MDNPRRTAVLALVKQEKSGYANLVLSQVLQNFTGTPRERAFVSAVFYGTIERQITLDTLLQPMLTKPLAKLDAEVRAILRAGLYQANYMSSVPPSAAVNESVALARALGKTSASGLVNAVLRKAIAADITQMPFANDTARLSALYSVSTPIVDVFQSAYGAMAEQELAATLAPSRLCVRVNTMLTDTQALQALYAKQNIATARGAVPNSLYVEYKGDITATKAFRGGLFHVQGEASQAACAALAPKPGCKVLDLCSAPGGKSATLAQYMENKGTLVSCDAAQNRLTLVGGALERLGVACGRVLHNDAAVYNEAFAGADAVLCDVPCSGLGVLAKKPDIRQKTLDGLDGLVRLQRAILETAARYVRPGGRLVYSTCTLNPDENAGIVRPFLKEHPEFRTRSVECVLPGTTKDDDFLTLYPFRTGTDGFFIASLERL